MASAPLEKITCAQTLPGKHENDVFGADSAYGLFQTSAIRPAYARRSAGRHRRHRTRAVVSSARLAPHQSSHLQHPRPSHLVRPCETASECEDSAMVVATLVWTSPRHGPQDDVTRAWMTRSATECPTCEVGECDAAVLQRSATRWEGIRGRRGGSHNLIPSASLVFSSPPLPSSHTLLHEKRSFSTYTHITTLSTLFCSTPRRSPPTFTTSDRRLSGSLWRKSALCKCVSN